MMFPAAARRPTAAWVLLVLATLLTGWLAETRAGLHWVAIVIILLASTKIAIVMSEFMELRTAPLVWRLVMGSWLLIVTTVVLSGHLWH
jgi:Prokaryotic Cytochrome C oxidase subunit IV